MKKFQQGFTLIELMIVVAIIGILAAIAIPQYQDFVARSQISEAFSLASGLKTAVVDVANQGDVADADSGNNGIPAALSVVGKYVTQVEVTDGVITATLAGAAPVSKVIWNAEIELEPTFEGGSVSWACTHNTEDKYVPQACR